MRKRKKSELLTEVELEFMTGLWELGQGTVRDVLDALNPPRDLAYTSAATIMRILDEKGFVSSKRDGKTFVYCPLLSKDEYQGRLLRDVSAKLFDNTPAAMVARLVDDQDLSVDALDEIRALLDRRMGKDERG